LALHSVYVFMEETMRKLLQNITVITKVPFPKFYLNQTNIKHNKKREKSDSRRGK